MKTIITNKSSASRSAVFVVPASDGASLIYGKISASLNLTGITFTLDYLKNGSGTNITNKNVVISDINFVGLEKNLL